MTIKKVVFTGASEAQNNFNRYSDANTLLKVGEVYEIEKEEIHSWHTIVWLVGVTGQFNSVCFDDIDENSE